MTNFIFISFFLFLQDLYSIETILVIPFKINSYIPKIEGKSNITDLLNQYLVHDMFSTIEIGSGNSKQKVTTLISSEESILSLSAEICKRKSLQTINDLSIVSGTGLNIKPYNSYINNKNYTNYKDNDGKLGKINDSILIYNTTFLSCQPIEYDSQKPKDTKEVINNVAMPIKDKNDNDEEKLCAILGIGSPLNKLGDIPQFINFLKKNKIIVDYSWTFKFHTREEGRLIIGDLPQNYESSNKLYHKDKYKKTETYSPGDENYPWSFHFKEISFVNSKNETVYVGKWIKMILVPNLGFIIGEDKYKNLILENYFQKLIDKNICILEKSNITNYPKKGIFYGESGIYEMFHCNKSIMDENIRFPNLNFVEPNLEYIFSFSFNNLFQLIDERYYFLVIFPEDITHAAYKVWYLGLPFYYSNQFIFNYADKTIGIYDQNIKIDDNEEKKQNDKDNNNNEKKEKKHFIGVWRIIIEIIIGILLVVGAYFIGKKINEQRKKRANELKDDNYDYSANEEKNINGTEENMIQNNEDNKNEFGY